MKLSTRARYALRMMVVIAREGREPQATSLGRVAEVTSISRRYLEQVVVGLRRGGLVLSTSGRAGGYQLARPPAGISVCDIVEAAIGPISIVQCVRAPEGCIKADVCACRWVYVRLNQGIREVLSSLSLADLAARRGEGPVCASLASIEHRCQSAKS